MPEIIIEQPVHEVEEVKEQTLGDMIELKTDLQLYMEKHQQELEVNPKKRKQQQSDTAPSHVTMTLRSRVKKRKLNNEDEDGGISQIGDEDATYCNGGENAQGASYIRYEIIEKKGKQIVVPVRYSIRRAKGGNKHAVP